MEMTIAGEGLPKRTRGKGFPVLALDEAVEAIKKAGRYGREHSVDDFAGLLGHETSNSGPFKRKIAALKDWGLIQRSPRAVVFTDLATRIAHPSSEEDEQAAIRQAFFEEAMFSLLFEEAAKEVDLSLDFLGGRAVNALGVSPRSKAKFARSFGRSVQAARLGELTGSGQVRLFDSGSPTELEPGQRTAADDADKRGGSGARHPRVESRWRPPTLHQEWPTDDGVLVFEARLERPLPAAAFSHVAEVASAVEGLVEVLHRASEEDVNDDQSRRGE